MKEFVKAFFALALVAGISVTASAQVSKSTGVPAQQPAGTVIVNSSPTTQSAPVNYPQATPLPQTAPPQSTQTVYNGPNAAQVQQIDAQLAQLKEQERQLHEQERQLREQERALHQQREQLTGKKADKAERHDNGKHKGWEKNGKAKGAHGHGYDDENDD